MPATAPGTLLFAIQAALVERLQERLVDARVSYEPPLREGDLATDQGVEDAVWFAVGQEAGGSDSSITYEAPNFSGQYSATNPLWLDEVVTFEVRVQSRKRDGSQADADARAAELLGDVLAAFATAPRITDTDTLQSHWIVPQSAQVYRGALPTTDGHACLIAVTIEARNRLKLT